MRKLVSMLMLIGFMVLSINAYATTSYKSNASPAIVSLDITQASRELVFPYKSRDLLINNQGTSGIWVNLMGGDVNQYYYPANRIFVDGGDTVELYDFVTDGITIFTDTFFANGNRQASKVSVIVIY